MPNSLITHITTSHLCTSLSPRKLIVLVTQVGSHNSYKCVPIFLYAAASTQKPNAEFAHENRQNITAKFGAFQTKVCDKLFKKGVDTDQFRLFAINQFPPGDCIPPPPASLTEIFKAITYHGLWDYLHYSPLVHIVQTFGANDPEMEGWVQTYKQDLKAYSFVTKVEEYVEADCDIADPPPAKRAKYDPRYYRPVEWKTHFVDHTLQYLTEVWELFSSRYVVPDSPPTALLDRVREGCFVVTWLIPTGLIPLLIKRAKIDTNFFQQYHILKVTVGGECVYDEEVTAEVSFLSRSKSDSYSCCYSQHKISTFCREQELLLCQHQWHK